MGHSFRGETVGLLLALPEPLQAAGVAPPFSKGTTAYDDLRRNQRTLR